MRVGYSHSFLRQLASLPKDLEEDAKQAIVDFCDRNNHVRLKVHKLKGHLAGRYAFSVNYHIRIVFRYETSEVAILTSIGDHDIYRP